MLVDSPKPVAASHPVRSLSVATVPASFPSQTGSQSIPSRLGPSLLPYTNHRAPSHCRAWTREAARLLLAALSSTPLHVLSTASTPTALIDKTPGVPPNIIDSPCVHIHASTVFATKFRNVLLVDKSKVAPQRKVPSSSPSSPPLFLYPWPRKRASHCAAQPPVQDSARRLSVPTPT
jgi:hypothetical protein